MSGLATESQRHWMKRIMRVLIPVGLAAVAMMALAASGVISGFWLFVGLAAYLGGLLGLSAWLWLIMRRARDRSPN